MTNIILVGASGRMGKQIASIAEQSKSYKIVASVDKWALADRQTTFSALDDIPDTLSADVLLDFSHFSALDDTLHFASERNMPVVIGVTGYSAEQTQKIHNAAKTLPVFFAPNMSIGVYALRQAAKQLAAMLKSFEIELVETHHNKKLDAPSGTALAILNDLSAETGLPVSDGSLRKKDEIGVHAMRGGTVAGIHEVFFYGEHEYITLKHTAESRSVFASGALSACGFMHGKESKGDIYTMQDLVRGG